MTAWLVLHPEDSDGHRCVMVAMPNAHGEPCVLVDELGAPVLIHRPPGIGTNDWARHVNRHVLPRFERIDDIFRGMLRRYA